MVKVGGSRKTKTRGIYKCLWNREREICNMHHWLRGFGRPWDQVPCS